MRQRRIARTTGVPRTTAAASSTTVSGYRNVGLLPAATRPAAAAVSRRLGGGITHIDDTNVKMERHPGEGVIRVEYDFPAGYLEYRHLFAVYRGDHSRFRLTIQGKRASRDTTNQGLVANAVSFLGRDDKTEFFPGAVSVYALVESRYGVTVSLAKRERAAVFTRSEKRPIGG